MNIYLLPNDRDPVTEFQPPLQTKTVRTKLDLRYGSTVFVVSDAASTCLIGRDDACNLKVEHRLVSRRHASIERVSGKFFLHDHSTNGTYVEDDGGTGPALIQREMYQLKGKGVISLGSDPKANADNLIRFAIGI